MHILGFSPEIDCSRLRPSVYWYPGSERQVPELLEAPMKAFVTTRYGSPDVLQLQDIPQPIPGPQQVLVKVHAVALNAADWHLMRADPFIVRLFFGPFRPKFAILGADISGTVSAVGTGVTSFKVGDEVFGDLSSHRFGGFAEYACTREDLLVEKPGNVSFGEAATVPMAGLTALQGLRDLGQIQPGKKVLINGASGGVGTFAVQIAKALGAEVTAVCSGQNHELARRLGADHVIDYTKEDFTQSGQHYDLILAANGYHPLADYLRALNPGGIYVMKGGAGKQMAAAIIQGPWVSLFSTRKVRQETTHTNQQDLLELKHLLEVGKLKPVIDRIYPFEQIPDAMRYLEEGHARGKIVVNVAG